MRSTDGGASGLPQEVPVQEFAWCNAEDTRDQSYVNLGTGSKLEDLLNLKYLKTIWTKVIETLAFWCKTHGRGSRTRSIVYPCRLLRNGR